MTFGLTSQGTKPCCPAYFILCVMQNAADHVVTGWLSFVGAGWRLRYRQANPKVMQDVTRVGNEAQSTDDAQSLGDI